MILTKNFTPPGAQNKGIRMFQYQMTGWSELHHSEFVSSIYGPLMAQCHKVSLIVYLDESELEPKQVFDFVGYQFNLWEAKVRPTLEQEELNHEDTAASH